MKKLDGLNDSGDAAFLFDVMLLDFFRVAWVYVIVWLVGYIWL